MLGVCGYTCGYVYVGMCGRNWFEEEGVREGLTFSNLPVQLYV